MAGARADESRRAARIAVAIDLPLYAVAAWGSAAAAAALLGRGGERRGRAWGAVAAIDATVLAVGIPLVAHTLGRALYGRTRALTPCRASLAFAGMGAALSLPAIAVVAGVSPRRRAGVVHGLLAVALPVAATAAVTRWLQPRVAARAGR